MNMKKICIAALIVAHCAAFSASVRLYFVDPFTNQRDTNSFYIQPVGTNVLSSGGVIGRGISTRVTPASDGYATNTLAVGHYSITNRSLGSGVVIRVPESSALIDYTNILISGYNIFVTVNNGSGGTVQTNISYTAVTNLTSFGAITNNDTRQVTFTDRLTIGSGATDGRIILTDGESKNYTAIVGDSGWQFGQPIEANGSLLTALNGSAISSGTVADARIASTIARDSEVTQATNDVVSNLAAGAYSLAGNGNGITNLNLSPFGISSTNTFYAVNTNAITVVTNANAGYNTNIIVVSNCETNAFNGSWYWNSTRSCYTNSGAATHGFTLDVNGGDFDTLPGITNPSSAAVFGAGTELSANGGTIDAWYFSTLDVSAMSTLYVTVDTYHAKFHGDGSGLSGISGYLTNQAQTAYRINSELADGTKAKFPASELFGETNTIFNVGNYVQIRSKRATYPANLTFSDTLHAQHGIVLVGATESDVVLNPTKDEGLLQLGITGYPGNYIYLQRATYAWAATNAQGFSHPLEFRSMSYVSPGVIGYKYPGIVGFSGATNTSELGELAFYARAPHWNGNNLNAFNPDTAGTEVMRTGTNGIVAASGIQFKGNGNGLTNIMPNIGSNSVAVSANISIYLTNQDGTVYRLSAQRIVP